VSKLLYILKSGRQGRRERLTGDPRHTVFMAGIRLCVDLVSKAWLNWCRWHDAAALSATARGSCFVGAGIRTWSGTATVKWQTGWVEYLGTGNKAQRIVCLLFSMSRLRSHWPLPPIHSPVISPAVAMCVCLPSPPVQGVHACVGVGGGGLELRKQSAKENATKLDYRLITG